MKISQYELRINRLECLSAFETNQFVYASFLFDDKTLQVCLLISWEPFGFWEYQYVLLGALFLM